MAAIAILALALLAGAESVRITELRVPAAVRNGSSRAALLDCVYALKAEEQGLVVKWFLNEQPAPVYQWIPGQEPQELGPLKGRLDLKHRAADNPLFAHRALLIRRPTTELSGDYRCSVATFLDEDFMTKKMIVFAPEKQMDLRTSKTSPDDDSVQILCSARGVYPEPKLTLYVGLDKRNRQKLRSVEASVEARGGAFDATVLGQAMDAELATPTQFQCELRIPDTDYSVVKDTVYYPGMFLQPESGSSCVSPSFFFLFLIAFFGCSRWL